MNITERMIAEAAAEMNDAMLNSLPNPDDCRHKFSARFERKMKRVIFRVDHPVQFRIIQRVASIVLVLFIGFATILAASPTVRAAVFGWIREQYDSFVTYYLEYNSSEPENPTAYYISGLPTAYTEIEVSDDPDNYTAIYGDNNGHFIYFCYSSTPGSSAFFISEKGYIVEDVLIHNHSANFYLSEDPAQGNSIIWHDENSRIIFFISGMMGKAELVELAESVLPKN